MTELAETCFGAALFAVNELRLIQPHTRTLFGGNQFGSRKQTTLLSFQLDAL
jgi:hypothetical protein